MARFFITGYTGFIGQNLLPFLQERQCHITGYSRSEQDTPGTVPDQKVTSLPETFNGFDAVIHMAGKAHDTKNTGLREEYVKANFQLTADIYDRFLQSNAQKFIFLSSVKAVADHAETPLREDALPAPGSVYGETKLQAENYILSNLPKDGREVYILRPCMIHGPGNKGNLNLLHKFITRGLPFPFGAIRNKRSFLSVSNLCMIIHALATRKIAGGIYHLADSGTISTADLVRLLAQISNQKAHIWNVPYKLINFIAKTGDALRLPANSQMVSKLAGNYIVDNGKILQALEEPLPISLTDGLRLTFQSFNKENK